MLGYEKNEDFSFFQDALSINGSTGCIFTPDMNILSNNFLSVGIHKFDIKVNYGLFSLVEIGFKSQLTIDQDWQDIFTSGQINSKLQLFRNKYFGVCVGSETPFSAPASPYLVMGLAWEKLLFGSFSNFGYGKEKYDGFFGSTGLVLYPGLMLLGEDDSRNINAGIRFLLSQRYKFDMFLTRINQFNDINSEADLLHNHLVFGLTYSEYLVFGL